MLKAANEIDQVTYKVRAVRVTNQLLSGDSERKKDLDRCAVDCKRTQIRAQNTITSKTFNQDRW